MGRAVDGRADLFSLGAILFECLTGRRAFSGHGAVEVMAQVLQAYPPRPSELRPVLDRRYDDVCQRLLEKDPASRFQSADEALVALRALQWSGPLDRTRARTNQQPIVSRRRLLTIGCAGILAGAAIIGWHFREEPLSPVPGDAARWYQRGTEALAEGAFQSASSALEQAIALFPSYPLAFARLAEARSELDDERGAERALVRMSNFLPDQSHLPTNERLRLEAIRSVVLRDLDGAIRAYQQLAQRTPQDSATWLDLGRAQEDAGRLDDARTSYERAVDVDKEYAAGNLHLGIIAARQGRRDDSLAAYSRAERLYHAASRAEGEAEVLIWRGAFLDGVGQFSEARAALEKARGIGGSINSPFHVVRAQLYLSSVTASEGRSQKPNGLLPTQ
jgi:tetratricopeptide (TPR) repeat protein